MNVDRLFEENMIEKGPRYWRDRENKENPCSRQN